MNNKTSRNATPFPSHKTSVDISQSKLVNTKKFSMSWIIANKLIQQNQIPIFTQSGTIEIYSLPLFQCEGIITGHANIVNYLIETSTHKIITCSYDNTIKIWTYTRKNNTNIYKCEKTLTEHISSVHQVIEINDNKFASCSWDSTIKIWNLKFPYECYYTLKQHKSGLTSILQLSNGILVSGSVDYTICFWDLKTQNCDKVISDVYCCSQNSLYEYNKVLYVGGINEIVAISIDNYQIISHIMINSTHYVYSLILLRDNSLLCGSQKGNLIHLDISTYKNKGNINIKGENILGLFNVSEDYFVSASSSDGVVSLWKY